MSSSWAVPYPETPKLMASALRPSRAAQEASERSITAQKVFSGGTCRASA